MPLKNDSFGGGALHERPSGNGGKSPGFSVLLPTAFWNFWLVVGGNVFWVFALFGLVESDRTDCYTPRLCCVCWPAASP